MNWVHCIKIIKQLTFNFAEYVCSNEKYKVFLVKKTQNQTLLQNLLCKSIVAVVTYTCVYKSGNFSIDACLIKCF